MKDKTVATKIRRELKPAIPFDFWVRVFQDNTISIGLVHGSKDKMRQLRCIVGLYYKFVDIGIPGTSGEYSLNLIPCSVCKHPLNLSMACPNCGCFTGGNVRHY